MNCLKNYDKKKFQILDLMNEIQTMAKRNYPYKLLVTKFDQVLNQNIQSIM